MFSAVRSHASGLARRAVASATAAAPSAGARAKHTLVLMRHGQSSWNLENRFTGWVDVPLTEKGVSEAQRGGKLLKEAGFEFDVAYTSVLRRATKTCWLALEQAEQEWVPVIRDYRLNERHYGGLSGLDKAETAAKYGDDQVTIWRRSFATPPPDMEDDHEFQVATDRRYAHVASEDIPKSESLKTTLDRVLPYWNDEIVPAIRSGKTVLVAAHGNSLRAMVKQLDGISDEDIIPVNIPTGVPLVYELDDDLNPIPQEGAVAPLTGRYLGDADQIAAEMAAVAAQAKAKKE